MLVIAPRRGVPNHVPQLASVVKPPSVGNKSTIHCPASKFRFASTMTSDDDPPNVRTRWKWQPFSGSL
jgi:hypothetical protein